MNDLTVKTLLEQLGFASTQSDLDESLKWALVELALRRQAAPDSGRWHFGHSEEEFSVRWSFDTKAEAIEAAPGELDLKSGGFFFVCHVSDPEEVEFQDPDCSGCDSPNCDACNAEHPDCDFCKAQNAALNSDGDES